MVNAGGVGMVPDNFTEAQWNALSHAERIQELYNMSRLPGISHAKLREIKDEISYYLSIQSQIRILTSCTAQ